jgi:hypothetical protein
MSISVPKKYREALKVGLQAYMQKNGLNLSSHPRVRTGDRAIADSTKGDYSKHYDGLYRFAAMIGYLLCAVL